jgi:hypothetical protein
MSYASQYSQEAKTREGRNRSKNNHGDVDHITRNFIKSYVLVYQAGIYVLQKHPRETEAVHPFHLPMIHRR